jgi:hypothetical protein
MSSVTVEAPDYATDPDGEVRAVGDAFEPDADGVSVTWVNFYNGSRTEQLEQVSNIIKSTRKVRASHRLAIVNVAAVIECGSAYGATLSVVHDPQGEPRPNPAHCLIEGIETAAAALRERLALKAQVKPFAGKA